MLVANSFDLWQKDAFFSAAEEVQDSADIMESAYRTWVRQRREGMAPHVSNELSRELQTALGTAKWQLDEFEKALRLSYKNHADDITTNRHRQFIAAIESQISRVEAELKESLNDDGQQPLRWVKLDEQERDDLAMFLSGTPGTVQSTNGGSDAKFGGSTFNSLSVKQYMEQKSDLDIKVDYKMDVSKETQRFEDVVTSNVDANYVIELDANETPGTSDGSSCDRTIGTRRIWNSPNVEALKVTIDAKNEEQDALILSIEATPKEKGSRSVFQKPRYGGHPRVRGGILCQAQLRGINGINQLFRMVRGSQRQLQTLNLQTNRPIQFTLALLIALLLIGKFSFHSITRHQSLKKKFLCMFSQILCSLR